MARPPYCVLTIAGSDSSAGAGILADSRTIQALGGYAFAALTAVTAQGRRGVRAWRAVPPVLIGAQIAAVMSEFPIAAAKTGLLSSPAAIRVVAGHLARRPGLPLVVDPVLGSTTGTRFLSAGGLRSLSRELLPRATIVTPNWPEAEALTGRRLRTHTDAEEAARQLADECGCAVLVKGGHAAEETCRDCLATLDGSLLWFSHSRVATRNTHGTGCVLSAAIAAYLARGAELADAVENARAFLRRSLESGRRIDWGRKGAGPAFAGFSAR